MRCFARSILKEYKQFLDATEEGWFELIANEEDPQAKIALEKKRRLCLDPKLRVGFEKNVAKLQDGYNTVRALNLDEAKPEKLENTLVRILEVVTAHDVPEIAKLSRDITTAHMFIVAPEGWRDHIAEHFRVAHTPTIQRLEALGALTRQYIVEHYLHAEQKVDRTHHTPFPPALVGHLQKIWKTNDIAGNMPIEIIADKAREIFQPQAVKDGKSIEVTMVPVAGIFRILSGDVGDSCHANQHEQLARGEVPGLHAWIYTTHRGKSNEAIRGSFLGIQTRTPEGERVLVGRANNPLQTFVQMLDADSFTLGTLKELVATARRMRAHRLENQKDLRDLDKRMRVVVPLDAASQSSTNRPAVNEVYHSRFGKNPLCALVNEPETRFNNYAIWDVHGAYRCCVIWSIDEHGNETWHGNWE